MIEHETPSPSATTTQHRRTSSSRTSPGPSISASTSAASVSIASPEAALSPIESRSSEQRISRQSPNNDARPGPTKGTKGKAKYIPNRVKRYHERSLDGCLTCRKRRVKCDEGKPVCRRCACGDRECVYADASQKSPTDTSFPHSASFSSSDYQASLSHPASAGLQVSALVHPEPPPYTRPHAPTASSRSSTTPRDGEAVTYRMNGNGVQLRYDGVPTDAALNPTGLSHPASPSHQHQLGHDPSDLYTRPSLLPNARVRYDPESLSRPGPSRNASTEDHRRRLPSSALRQAGADIDISKLKLPELPAGFGFENLEPFFPTYEQLCLFRHYILEVVPQLCVAQMPLSDNRWIRHHATFAVRHPAGTNGYEDALRSVLLSMASLDLGHKLSQAHIPDMFPLSSARLGYPSPNSDEYGANAGSRGTRQHSAASGRSRSDSGMFGEIAAGSTSASMMSNVLLELSNLRREESLRLLRTTLQERRAPLNKSNAAIMLATVLGLATRDRLAAQQDWQEALSIASKAIAELGGPAAFVDQTNPSSLFLIEQIACFDALSSLTSDDYTLFLQPWDDWWYALMDSPRNIKEDSVLQTFGLHRGMIDMLARMTRVEATRRELQARTGVTIILSEKVGGGSPPDLPPEYEETRLWLESTARALVAEIPIWAKMPFPKEATRTLQAFLPVIMNHLYVATAELYIHSVIFSKPADHPSFHEPTSVVLNRSEEAIQAGITKGLLLPISMAAFSASKKDRERIQIMLNDLRPYYKFDLDRMEKLNEHLWRMVDSGLTPSDWHLFMKSVGCFNWAF